MAQVTVVKPQPTLVPSSSVKGYRPEFVGDPGRTMRITDPPFVVKTGPRHGNYAANTRTLAPGATLNVGAKNTGPHTQLGSGRRKAVTRGKADPRRVSGFGRSIIPHDGMALGNPGRTVTP
jgi:hypothetical protein